MESEVLDDNDQNIFFDQLAEEDPNSRYVDYTSATSWEHFILDIENLLRKWNLNTDISSNSNDNKDNNISKNKLKSSNCNEIETEKYEKILETIEYEGENFEIILIRKMKLPIKERSDEEKLLPSIFYDEDVQENEKRLNSIENLSLDFDNAVYDLQQWFGMEDFLLIKIIETQKSIYGYKGMSKHKASWMLSSISIACSNCLCSLPALVPIGPILNSCGNGFFGKHGIMGYTAPSKQFSCKTRFESVRLVKFPEMLLSLDGLMEIFLSKLQDVNISAFRPNTIDDDYDNNYENGNSNKVSISVQHSWHHKIQRKYESLEESLDWRLSHIRDRTHAFAKPYDFALRRVLSYYRSKSYMDLWGSLDDPLSNIRLSIRWLQMLEGSFVENSFYSTFQPLATPPRAWHIKTSFDNESSNDNTEQEMQLSNLLRNLLAAWIYAQSVDPGTTMSELCFKSIDGGSDDIDEDVERGRNQRARSIGSVLQPSTFRYIENMEENSSSISRESLNDILELLFDDSSNSNIESEGGLIDEEKFRRSLWNWFPQSSSPIGRIISLLSLKMAELDNLRAMATLWSEFVKELRWRWDAGVKIPRMGRIPCLDGEFTISNDNNKTHEIQGGSKLTDVDGSPDMDHCLIYQKLEMLNICVDHQRKVRGDSEVNVNSVRSESNFDDSYLEDDDKNNGNDDLKIDDLKIDMHSEDDDEFFDSVDESGSLDESSENGNKDNRDYTKEDEEQDSLKEQDNVLSKNEDDSDECNNDGLSRKSALSSAGYKMLEESQFDVFIPDLQISRPLTTDVIMEHNRLLANLDKDSDENLKNFKNQLHRPKLLSDIQAFKAANPGCNFADFVRWYYPDDWFVEGTNNFKLEMDKNNSDANNSDDGDDIKEETMFKRIWPGFGCIGSRFFDDTDDNKQLLNLWTSANPIPIYEQKLLFDSSQEAEKVLHYFETLSPFHVMSQLLCSAYSSSHFILCEAQTSAINLDTVCKDLNSIEDISIYGIECLHEEQSTVDILIVDDQLAHAVSQSTLRACESICDAVYDLEKKLMKATSLLYRLPDQFRLVEVMMANNFDIESKAVQLENEDERKVLLSLFGVNKGGDISPDHDDMRDDDDNDDDDDDDDYNDLKSENTETHFSRLKKNGTEDEDESLFTSNAFELVLPTAKFREYVLRCMAPSSSNFSNVFGDLSKELCVAPITSRMYAAIYDSKVLQIATSINESEL